MHSVLCDLICFDKNTKEIEYYNDVASDFFFYDNIIKNKKDKLFINITLEFSKNKIVDITKLNIKHSEKGFENNAIRNLLNKIIIMFIFNLSLTPTLILIPFLFGEEFSKSVQIGIFLFAFKFLVQATSILEIIANLKRQNLFLLLQVIGWLISFTLCSTILEMKSLSSLVICLYIAQSMRLSMAFINIKHVVSQERKI